MAKPKVQLAMHLWSADIQKYYVYILLLQIVPAILQSHYTDIIILIKKINNWGTLRPN